MPDGLAPAANNDYFIRISHARSTRGNNKNLVLAKVRCESGRKAFAFYGRKIFNIVPNDMKTETSILRYKTKLNMVDLRALL